MDLQVFIRRPVQPNGSSRGVGDRRRDRAIRLAAVTADLNKLADAGIVQRYGLQRPLVAVERCRKIGKKDLPLNDATPDLRVDPDTYRVWADGELLTCEPAAVLPMAQRYFLF